MSNIGEVYRLTEGNLLHHNDLLLQNPNILSVPWAEKVIKQEQIHLFFSHYQVHGLKPGPLGDPRYKGKVPAMECHPDHPMESVKLFEERRGICLENPLERFLTPDGCSDTAYFARVALKQIGLQFGGMEGLEERKKMASENVQVIVKNQRSVGKPLAGQESGRNCSA